MSNDAVVPKSPRHHFKSVGGWRNTAREGETVNLRAHFSFEQIALAHIPDTTHGVRTLLHFLEPEYTKRHGFTDRDVGQMMGLVNEFIQHPSVPRALREEIRLHWDDLKLRITAANTPKPATPEATA